MGLREDIDRSFRRLIEDVDRVSDKEARVGFDDIDDQDLDNDGDTDESDEYLYTRQSKVAKVTEEEELDEMSTTAGVPGYQTPYAFGDADEDTWSQGGMKKVAKTNKIFKPMESKSAFKKMMAEMYGVKSTVNEASNPVLDKTVDKFVKALATKNGYKRPDAVMAIFESLKRLNYIHPSVDYKSPSGYGIEESISYRDYKKDPTSTPQQKVNKGIAEVNRMLSEMEKIVHNNLRLKTEMGVQSNHFWKSTGSRFAKINERMTRIANKLKELSQ